MKAITLTIPVSHLLALHKAIEHRMDWLATVHQGQIEDGEKHKAKDTQDEFACLARIDVDVDRAGKAYVFGW